MAFKEDLPDKFRISWVVIQEPSKGDRKEGGLYLWIRKLNEVNTAYGVPRSYKLNWSEENHKVAQAALHKLKEGEQLNGTKTYGVLDKENEGNKANQYKSEDGELEEVDLHSSSLRLLLQNYLLKRRFRIIILQHRTRCIEVLPCFLRQPLYLHGL